MNKVMTIFINLIKKKDSIILLGVSLLFLFTLSNCVSLQDQSSEQPVAKVYDNYLYPSDLEHIFSSGVNKQDSLLIAKNYVDNWIKEQLLLFKAEMNLTEEQKNVERQLENYRTSLLIYKYEEEYVKQKLDTVVSVQDIEKYYEENKQNFILDNTILKVLYIKIPRNLPYQEIYNLRRWYRSENEEDRVLLDNLCVQYAEKYDDFDDKWVYFREIQSQIPRKINNPDVFFKYNKYVESMDSLYRYYVKINNFVPKSEAAPLEFVESRIQSILLNKRKITLIKQLENKIYNEAMNRDNIKVY